MPNQYKPLPPNEDIREPFTLYYNLGMNDKDICLHMVDHYDADLYGLSVISIRRLRKQWGLTRTRQQKHTFETIANDIREIRVRFPLRGANTIRKNLRELHGKHVPRELISRFLKAVEPRAVEARKSHRFKRKRYWAAGVNDVWPQDQHDKWMRFGLFFHQSCDAFSGSFNWFKVWWTNSNPRLITSYYLEACRKHGGVPLVTQSDPGPENFGVANAQTVIRHRLDPSLSDTLQHRWMRKHQNIKSEIKWSIFRRDWSPGFEDILDEGVLNGFYDVENVLENLVFRWLAIPWIQAEVNDWMMHRNRSKPRADKHKILPHGIPDIIRAKPEHFGSYDFKVVVPTELFDEIEKEYAPREHPVFKLVPPAFDQRANILYSQIEESLAPVLTAHRDTLRALEVEEIQLLPNLKELRNSAKVVGPPGSRYIGGMVHGPPVGGLRKGVALEEEEQEDDDVIKGSEEGKIIEPQYADFTSSESDSGEDDENNRIGEL